MIRYFRKKQQCFAWDNPNNSCIQNKKCTIFCSEYHKTISKIYDPNDYLTIIHSKQSRKLASLALVISIFTLILTALTEKITIILNSKEKAITITSILFDSIKE